jgi:hypothetical protein
LQAEQQAQAKVEKDAAESLLSAEDKDERDRLKAKPILIISCSYPRNMVV